MRYLLALLVILVSPKLCACTGIKLVAKDGSIIHGRTLEFGVPLDTSIAVVPRGYRFIGTTTQGVGLAYTTKYAAVGTAVFESLEITDGLNEKGLSVGTFYFPGYAEYAAVNEENRTMALSPLEFPNWVVTQFATVAEVKAALSKVVIAEVPVKGWGERAPPFHYIVYDKTGNCIVIEPIKGKLVSYENKLGVLTNSPTFDWQVTNLQNYINLKPENAAPLQLNGVKLSSFGQGSGLLGLPGDFSPPSRFVRAALFSSYALPADNAEACVFQVFHILNQFDIPYGAVRPQKRGDGFADYTMATCVRDSQALKYYFKTYDNQGIRVVDLMQFDLNAKIVKTISTAGNETIQDISSELEKSSQD